MKDKCVVMSLTIRLCRMPFRSSAEVRTDQRVQARITRCTRLVLSFPSLPHIRYRSSLSLPDPRPLAISNKYGGSSATRAWGDPREKVSAAPSPGGSHVSWPVWPAAHYDTVGMRR
jgi:hypothetical protein